MKTFDTVYPWNIIDKIKEGKLVYCLDKEEQRIFCVNDMPVENYVAILEKCNAEETRYTFWLENHIEEKTEENKE